jgi:hypothetical protein
MDVPVDNETLGGGTDVIEGGEKEWRRGQGKDHRTDRGVIAAAHRSRFEAGFLKPRGGS